MNLTFNQYVKQLILQMDVDANDEQDIYEELVTHLELSKKQFIQSGLNEKDAEKKAMAQFGNPKKIGEEIQDAMFPMRRFLLSLTAYLSIAYAFFAYSAQLFYEGYAHFVWLILAIVFSVCLWFMAEHIGRFFRSLPIRVTVHIGHILIFLYGSFLLSAIDAFVAGLSLVAWFIMLLSILGIYQLAIYNYRNGTDKQSKQIIIIHVINITLGIFYIGFFLFFTWGVLLFSEGYAEVFGTLRFYMFIATLLVWIICYYVQIKWSERTKTVLWLFLAPAIYFISIVLFLQRWL